MKKKKRERGNRTRPQPAVSSRRMLLLSLLAAVAAEPAVALDEVLGDEAPLEEQP